LSALNQVRSGKADILKAWVRGRTASTKLNGLQPKIGMQKTALFIAYQEGGKSPFDLICAGKGGDPSNMENNLTQGSVRNSLHSRIILQGLKAVKVFGGKVY
jgi:hypothetical protein